MYWWGRCSWRPRKVCKITSVTCCTGVIIGWYYWWCASATHTHLYFHLSPGVTQSGAQTTSAWVTWTVPRPRSLGSQLGTVSTSELLALWCQLVCCGLVGCAKKLCRQYVNTRICSFSRWLFSAINVLLVKLCIHRSCLPANFPFRNT